MNRRRIPGRLLAILLATLGAQAACGGSGNKAGSGGATAAGSGAGTTGATGGSSSSSTTGAAGGTSGSGPGSPDSGAPDAGAPDGGGLNPAVAPGGNFDLSLWELQEPVGSPGAPTTILPAALAGPNGFHDTYFYTDPTDGAMTFWDPENGVTTPNSDYPRCELRELNPDGSAANWPVAGTNTLSATVRVVKVPDHVCVGQIHLGTAIQSGLAASTKPLLELYSYSTGALVLGIEDGPSGNQTTHPITTLSPGARFSYTIELAGDGTITLTVNGTASTFTMPASFNGYGMYFKAGDYDQTVGTDGTVGAIVQFYALSVSH